MAGFTVAPSAAEQVAAILDSDEVAALVRDLDELRWTGRKGYGARTLVAACLVKSLYALPTWTKVAALIAEHRTPRGVCGGAASHWACYRFAAKHRREKPLLDACLDRVAASLRAGLRAMGREIAIDATDMPGYSNGQSFTSVGPRTKPFSDPDAAWGFRSAVSTRKRLLRVQASPRRLREDGPSARLARRERKQARDAVRPPASRRRSRSRLRAGSVRV